MFDAWKLVEQAVFVCVGQQGRVGLILASDGVQERGRPQSEVHEQPADAAEGAGGRGEREQGASQGAGCYGSEGELGASQGAGSGSGEGRQHGAWLCPTHHPRLLQRGIRVVRVQVRHPFSKACQ